ncbi:hypothetical protein BDZ89DRAFT_174913 [Hymenopellis radicata]|nr:hypothetical protein BDZ89DRAFT_174913 [Hymenopellis radicata]
MVPTNDTSGTVCDLPACETTNSRSSSHLSSLALTRMHIQTPFPAMPKQLEMHSWPASRRLSMLLALNLSSPPPWKTSSAQIPHALRSTHQTKPISFFTIRKIYISTCTKRSSSALRSFSNGFCRAPNNARFSQYMSQISSAQHMTPLSTCPMVNGEYALRPQAAQGEFSYPWHLTKAA